MQQVKVENNIANLRNRKIQSIKDSLKKITIISKNTLKVQSKIKFAEEQQKTQFTTQKITDRTLEPHKIQQNIKQAYLFQEKYQMLEKIGEGANGFVNKCRNVKTGKIYAVKSLMMDEEHIMELKENFLAIRALDHPRIVHYKSLYIDMRKKLCSIVMEYVNLPSLQKIKFRNLEELKTVIYQLLESLKYLHERNISHRDLKPENVLYDQKTKNIKIIDFGTSKSFFRRNTKVDMLTITGTLFYRAPQMFSGGGYDEKVDIWSVGILLYRLIAGKTPFESNYLSQTINKIKDQNPCFYESVWATAEKGLINLIKRMLKKDKNARLNSSECLRDVWFYTLNFKQLNNVIQNQSHGVRNSECEKKNFLNLENGKKKLKKLNQSIKKVDGEDYHLIDSEDQESCCTKSVKQMKKFLQIERKCASVCVS